MRGMAVDIKVNDFNPRPPRGGRQNNKQVGPHFQVFQSTPSARRATHALDKMASNYLISIHALREEGDSTLQAAEKRFKNFNPRPPRGGRLSVSLKMRKLRYFNPRPPRGGRRSFCSSVLRLIEFQSTPSARRATEKGGSWGAFHVISIHALREEGDCITTLHFNK